MRGREGGTEAGPADTHFLSRSLCVTQDCPISSQRSLTERLSLSPLAFQIVPSPLTRLTSAPPLPSPSAPFNTSLLTIVCLQNDNRKETILRVPLLLLLLATPFSIISRRLNSPDAGKMLPSIELL